MATAAGGTLASPSQPYDAPASPPQDLQAALAQSASSGQTALVRELLHKGANVDCPDAQGLTPCMLAVLGGHLDTAVQIALSGADLKRRAARGRTALELAVLASHREAALALVLIATNKFTRPLAPLLPGATLLRLHHWVLDRTGKNSKAAAVVSHVASLSIPHACYARPAVRVVRRKLAASSRSPAALLSSCSRPPFSSRPCSPDPNA